MSSLSTTLLTTTLHPTPTTTSVALPPTTSPSSTTNPSDISIPWYTRPEFWVPMIILGMIILTMIPSYLVRLLTDWGWLNEGREGAMRRGKERNERVVLEMRRLDGEGRPEGQEASNREWIGGYRLNGGRSRLGVRGWIPLGGRVRRIDGVEIERVRGEPPAYEHLEWARRVHRGPASVMIGGVLREPPPAYGFRYEDVRYPRYAHGEFRYFGGV